MQKLKNPKLFLFVAVLTTGILIGYFVLPRLLNKNIVSAVRRNPTTIREPSTYPLISPLLACDFSSVYPSSKYKELAKTIENLISQKESVSEVTNVSVYFRSLQDGRWTGVHENDAYSPASLFKIPLMIAYFRNAMEHPSILNEQLQYDGKFQVDVSQVIEPNQTLQAGNFYTVNDLVKRMIVYSDNVSEQVLLSHLDPAYLQEVFTDLGLSANVLSQNQDSMSAKSFSLFFRVLYNATYLNREMSEKALELLAKSSFGKGILAGLPANTVVAHKFGERTYVDQNSGAVLGSQLHECGIVYLPGKPYLLCVMTRGSNYTTMENTIQSISRAVYNDIIQ